MVETEDYDKSADPTVHASSHESGGSDQIDASGLVHLSAVRATLSADQTAVKNTNDQIEFDVAALDRNSDFNTGTFRFIAPVDGPYLVSLKVYLLGVSDATLFLLLIKKNGALLSQINHGIGRSGDTCLGLVEIVELTASDYLEFFIFHNNSTDKTIKSDSHKTALSIIRLY